MLWSVRVVQSLFEVTRIEPNPNPNPSGSSTASHVLWFGVKPGASRIHLEHTPPPTAAAATEQNKAPPALTGLVEGAVLLDGGSAAPASAAAAASADHKQPPVAVDAITAKLRELTGMIDTFFSVQLMPPPLSAPPQSDTSASAAAKPSVGGGGGSGLLLSSSRAVLLSGVSGVGKTFLCQRLTAHYAGSAAPATSSAARKQPKITVLYASALEIITSIMAEVEEDDRPVNDNKSETADSRGTTNVLSRLLDRSIRESPSLVLLDDIDSIMYV